MNLRHILAPTFSLALALTLTACGGADSSTGTPTGDNSQMGNNGENNGGENNGGENNGGENNANNTGENNQGVNNADPNNADPNNSGENNADPNNASTGEAVYYGDIEKIVGDNCTGCHVDGGAGPFPLTSYADLVTYGEAAQYAINEGIMPPWQANPDCRHFVGERIMSQVEKDRFNAWIAAGKQEGDPADALDIDPEIAGLDDPDMVARSLEPFTPNTSTPDDYRCLVMDAAFDEDKLLGALNLVPDVVPIVHHALIYLIPPSGTAQVAQRDAADPGAGYTCFGGPGVGGNQLIGVWVPGAVPMRFPEGASLPIPQGSQIVVQIHYNTVNGVDRADHSALELQFVEGDARQFEVAMPILLGNVNIPAGEPAAMGQGEYTNNTGQDLILLSAMPHMHLLGKSIDLWIEREGQEDECLVEVEEWDFNWQQFYELPADDWETLAPGDTVRWTCVWDNSPGNQPIVNGEQLEPRNVRFGEGTYDEMCVYILTLLVPLEMDQGVEGTCEANTFDACEAGCADGRCLVDCAAQAGPGCSSCYAQGLGACGQSVGCGTQLSAIIQCLEPCWDGNNLASCIAEGADCAPAWDTYYACIEDELADGTCDPAFTDCGL